MLLVVVCQTWHPLPCVQHGTNYCLMFLVVICQTWQPLLICARSELYVRWCMKMDDVWTCEIYVLCYIVFKLCDGTWICSSENICYILNHMCINVVRSLKNNQNVVQIRPKWYPNSALFFNNLEKNWNNFKKTTIYVWLFCYNLSSFGWAILEEI